MGQKELDVFADYDARIKKLEGKYETGFANNITIVYEKLDSHDKRLDIHMDRHDTQFKLMAHNFQDVKNDIRGLKTDFGSLKDDVSILKTDFGSLKDDVSILKTDVGGLKDDVSILKTDVSRIDGKLDSLSSEMSEIKTLLIEALAKK